MPEPAFGEEGGVEEEGGDDGAGYEEGLEGLGADVGDVGDGLVGVHGRVLGFAGGGPVDEEAEEGAEPAEGGDEGEDLGGVC